MKAIIMAGGEGTRLRPLTCNKPKPMLKVANKPVIDYTVDLLKHYGINEIGVTLQYLPKCIQHHLEGNKDVRFEFFTERVPLGTAGSIKNCESFLDDDSFLVMSGDGLTDIDLSAAIKYHKEKNADLTIVLMRVENPLEYGIVITDENGKIIRFAEKPSWNDVFSDSVNTGIYIINRNVLDLVEDNKKTDFSNDLFPLMEEKGLSLYGYVAEGYWCDIGNLKSYIRANFDVISGKVGGIDLKNEYYEIKKGVFVGKYAKLDESAELNAPCLIGNESTVKGNVKIGPETVVGSGCFIGKESSLKSSVIHDNVYIGEKCQIRGSVISDGCSLGDNVDVFEGSAIADDCSLGNLTSVKNGSLIWPEKRIEEESTVIENIIWQTEKFSRYFSNERITGSIVSEITPEFALACGRAFADRTDGRIIIANNGTPASEMLCNSVLAGIMSSGEQTLELKAIPLPAARFAVRFFRAEGGIYIGERTGNAELVFIDKNGSDISQKDERALENALISKNYRKNRNEILFPQNLSRSTDFYERHIINLFGSITEAERKMSIRVIDNDFIESKVFINVLSELGLDFSVFKREETEKEDWKTYDLTVELADFGEKLLIYDKELKPLDKNTVNLLLNYIAVKSDSDDTYIIADYNAPEAVDEIAKANNGAVVRVKSGTRALINEIVKHDGISDGLSIGKMSMYYDGIVFFAELIRFLNKTGKSIDEIVSALPSVYFSEREIRCPWEKRSYVMRKLADISDRSEVANGIKIRQKYGWSLVLPDAKRAVFKIYSQGFSTEYAEELSDICIKKINEYKEE